MAESRLALRRPQSPVNGAPPEVGNRFSPPSRPTVMPTSLSSTTAFRRLETAASKTVPKCLPSSPPSFKEAPSPPLALWRARLSVRNQALENWSFVGLLALFQRKLMPALFRKRQRCDPESAEFEPGSLKPFLGRAGRTRREVDHFEDCSRSLREVNLKILVTFVD